MIFSPTRFSLFAAISVVIKTDLAEWLGQITDHLLKAMKSTEGIKAHFKEEAETVTGMNFLLNVRSYCEALVFLSLVLNQGRDTNVNLLYSVFFVLFFFLYFVF